MIQICKAGEASRDLVLAAMLHDICYSGLTIPGTLQGAAWEAHDMRQQHMRLGASMSDEFLTRLITAGESLTEERKDQLVEIIRTHDNPYIGIPLTNKDSLLHRDADLAFVVSAASFWKDYLAYVSQPRGLSSVGNIDGGFTPTLLLERRRASFENEEPMTSRTGQVIVSGQLERRKGEIGQVMAALRTDPEGEQRLVEVLTEILIADFEALRKH